MDDGKKLTRELKDLVETYLSARKGRSRQSLAKDTGIAYNTITRILQLETVPSFESSYAILKVVADSDRVQSFLETYYPSVYSLVKDQVQAMNESGNGFGGLELDEVFSDSLGFLVFCLAASVEGTVADEIEENYGKIGRMKLEQMLENGFCQEINGRVRLKTTVIMDHQVLSRGIRRTLDIVDSNRRNIPYLLSWYCLGLNEDGIQKATECAKGYKKEMMAIFLDKANQGDVMITWGDVMGHMDEQQFLKRKDSQSTQL